MYSTTDVTLAMYVTITVRWSVWVAFEKCTNGHNPTWLNWKYNTNSGYVIQNAICNGLSYFNKQFFDNMSLKISFCCKSYTGLGDYTSQAYITQINKYITRRGTKMTSECCTQWFGAHEIDAHYDHGAEMCHLLDWNMNVVIRIARFLQPVKITCSHLQSRIEMIHVAAQIVHVFRLVVNHVLIDLKCTRPSLCSKEVRERHELMSTLLHGKWSCWCILSSVLSSV